MENLAGAVSGRQPAVGLCSYDPPDVASNVRSPVLRGGACLLFIHKRPDGGGSGRPYIADDHDRPPSLLRPVNSYTHIHKPYYHCYKE
ncbi:MAG: hypothetical protein AB1791_18455 [Chloroflexota bacterium]